MKYYFALLLAMILVSSCGDADKTKATMERDVHKVVVQEVLNVNEYTYIRVLEEGEEKWIAAPTTAVEVGATYYYGNTMEMKNFESKELNKTFETIYFIEKISTTAAESLTPLSSPIPHPISILNTDATKPVIEKAEVNIEAAGGTISIAELYQNKEKYNNTVVQIQGKVTKFNPAIMNVNWVHIEDGTDFNGEFDLTVTTLEEVQLEDIITVKGKVILNKDFGAGYVYAVLIENATITK
jgi:hypothetical protein